MNKIFIKIINIWSIFAVIMVLLMIIMFNLYSLSINKTNHAGFDISRFFTTYFLMFALSIIIPLYHKYKKYECNYKAFILLFIICIIGMINIIIFEKFNIMMPYEVWIKKGMPEKLL
jgi:hypothetical protein